VGKELLKMSREIRTDIEMSLFANKAKVARDAVPTAGVCAGMGAWIATNDVLGDAGGSPESPTGDGTDTRDDGTQRPLLESHVKTAMLGAWTNGGQPDWIITGGFNKQVISTFSGVATPVQMHSERGKIIAGVDYYQSDFGTVKVIANRFSRARDVWILQKDLWTVAFVRSMFVKKLAPTGDAEKRGIYTDFTLQAGSEDANGLVADCTTS
jgi:hypothetical protein